MTLLEKITARRRSTDPHCWTCKTYPNCNMCARKPSLRGQPKRQLTPEQKQACRKIIKTASPPNPTITPQAARVKAEIAKQLELIGILTLVKKAEYPCKYLYKLNTTHPLIEKAWLKHKEQQRKKLNKTLNRKP